MENRTAHSAFRRGAIALAALAACLGLASCPRSMPAEGRLELSWATTAARSLYPRDYPLPASFGLVLTAVGEDRVELGGLTGASYSVTRLARTEWTVSITGYDGQDRAIVSGGGAVDLTDTASGSLHLVLRYIHEGSGSGSIRLTLDLAAAPEPCSELLLTLTAPDGTVSYYSSGDANPAPGRLALDGGGAAGSFVLAPALAGSYLASFTAVSGQMTAPLFETVEVFQNVETAADLAFPEESFSVPFRAVTGVSLLPESLTLYLNGSPASLAASVAPANATNRGMSWSSSDESVAAISNGAVAPKGLGKATITVSTAEGGFEDTCAVTVALRYAASVSVEPASLTLVRGGPSARLAATVLPADASHPTVTWTSSDESVVAVDGTGLATPRHDGPSSASAVITATSADGRASADVAVTVLPNGSAGGSLSVSRPASRTVTVSGPVRIPELCEDRSYAGSYSGNAASYRWYVDGLAQEGATTASFAPRGLRRGSHAISLRVADQDGSVYSGSLVIVATDQVYRVGYSAPDAETGAVPVDAALRCAGETASVLGNPGDLSRSGYVLGGWSTEAGGAGRVYRSGDSLSMPAAELTLHALWLPSSSLLFALQADGSYAVTGLDSYAVTDLVVPAYYDGAPVRSIAAEAFKYKSWIASAALPEGLVSVGGSAFIDCSNLVSAPLPSTLRSLGYGAFQGCVKLARIELPACLTRIEGYAFQGCAAASGELAIPDGVTAIDGTAFSGCAGLSGLSFGSGSLLATIGENAFNGCSGLDGTLALPSGLTTIGDGAFTNCRGLDAIALGPSLASIGRSAFSDCDGLTSITIPAGVAAMGGESFANCDLLASVTMVPEIPPSAGSTAIFANCPLGLGSIRVPSAGRYKYNTYFGWSGYQTQGKYVSY